MSANAIANLSPPYLLPNRTSVSTACVGGATNCAGHVSVYVDIISGAHLC